MKNKHWLASGILLLAVAGKTACAQDAKWYVGAGLGYSTFNVHLNHLLGGASPGATGLKEDKRDLGWKVLGGYRFNSNFSLAFEYARLGKYALSDPAGVLGAPGGRVDGDISAYSASLAGSLPLTERWSAIGRLGIGRVVAEVGVTSGSRGKYYTEDHAALAPVLAAGMDYKLGPSWSVRGEYAFYGKPRVFHEAGEKVNADISHLSLSVLYSF